MSNITPKPTVYRGTKFRSRLEARWAVFLDHHFCVDEWHYEPRKFTLPQLDWDYRPDFLVKLGPIGLYLEIKPDLVSKEYFQILTQFTRVIRVPFYLAIGSFYRGRVPALIQLQADTPYPAREDFFPMSNLFARCQPALRIASNFRFDLKPGRQGD